MIARFSKPFDLVVCARRRFNNRPSQAAGGASRTTIDSGMVAESNWRGVVGAGCAPAGPPPRSGALEGARVRANMVDETAASHDKHGLECARTGNRAWGKLLNKHPSLLWPAEVGLYTGEGTGPGSASNRSGELASFHDKSRQQTLRSWGRLPWQVSSLPG